ncbi:MAG: NUDIX domain-containing protein [Microcoleaceae cyanobacterium]
MTIKKLPVLTVGALVESSSQEILIVETTKWNGTWGVPGGKVDFGEKMEDALIREFQEEVGLQLINIRFALLQEAVLDAQFYQPAHFALVNYLANTESTEITPNQEIVNWTWVTPTEALTYPLNSYTKILIDYFMKNKSVE